MKISCVYILATIIFIVIIFFLGGGIRPAYFDDNAKVMYFYSDSCHVCEYIKPALENLGQQGYRIKPMNIFSDKTLLTKYNIQGTPTFVGPDSDRISGTKQGETVEQFESRLKQFLDKY